MSLMESLPKVSRAGRPETRESFGETSLRRAVLGVEVGKDEEGMEGEVEVEVKTEEAEGELEFVPMGAIGRAYSGAWP